MKSLRDADLTPEQVKVIFDTHGPEKGVEVFYKFYDHHLERWKAQNEAAKPGREAVFRYGELAIKSLLLLCGGAAVAVLSFAGGKTGSGQASIDAFAAAVTYFGYAAAGAVGTAGLSYLSQASFMAYEKSWWTIGEILRWIAIVFWLASLATFVGGVHMASDAVLTANAPKPVAPITQSPAPATK